MDFAGGLSSRTQIREWNIDGSANVTDAGGERNERYQLAGVEQAHAARAVLLREPAGVHAQHPARTEPAFTGRRGVGKFFVRTNRAEWLGGVGLAYSRENYLGQDPLDSLEMILGTQFSIFRYDFPETDIGGSLVVLPSLTESGRYRSEADLRAKYEFVDDLVLRTEDVRQLRQRAAGRGCAEQRLRGRHVAGLQVLGARHEVVADRPDCWPPRGSPQRSVTGRDAARRAQVGRRGRPR